MKNYKQILEAIHRGINLALDDFDDNEPVSVQKSGKIVNDNNATGKYLEITALKSLYNLKNVNSFYNILWAKKNKMELSDFTPFDLPDHIKEIIFNYIQKSNLFEREYIDLNLSSGTLWCTNNIGGTLENQYMGNEYQMGSLEEAKYEYGFRQTFDIPKKYLKLFENTDKMIDTNIETKDDPAYGFNKHYRTPSCNQFREMIENTNVFDIGDGLIFASKNNPLDFIFFGPKNELYMTIDIANYEKNKPMNGISKNKVITYFIKLYHFNEFKYTEMPFKSLQNNKFPPAAGHIRPIYIK